MKQNSVNHQIINTNIAYHIVSTIAILILVGCTSQAPKTQSNSEVTKTEADNDTFVVDGKSVVFFSITNMEYDSLLKIGDKADEIVEVLSDFYHYSENVIDSLNKTGINCSISAKPIYKIVKDNGEVIIFSKAGKEHIVGAIMTDGKQKPKYYYGVATDVDYFGIINDYFNKK